MQRGICETIYATGTFFIHCDQMSELAGRDLHLDVRPRPSACSRTPGSIPPRCQPLEKHCWGVPTKNPVWVWPPPFAGAQSFKGGRNAPHQ